MQDSGGRLPLAYLRPAWDSVPEGPNTPYLRILAPKTRIGYSRYGFWHQSLLSPLSVTLLMKRSWNYALQSPVPLFWDLDLWDLHLWSLDLWDLDLWDLDWLLDQPNMPQHSLPIFFPGTCYLSYGWSMIYSEGPSMLLLGNSGSTKTHLSWTFLDPLGLPILEGPMVLRRRCSRTGRDRVRRSVTALAYGVLRS